MSCTDPPTAGQTQSPIEIARARKRIAQQTYRARQKKYVTTLEKKIETLHSQTYEEVNKLLSGNLSLTETLRDLRQENKQLKDKVQRKMQYIKTRGNRSSSSPAPPPAGAASMIRFSDEPVRPSHSAVALMIKDQYEHTSTLPISRVPSTSVNTSSFMPGLPTSFKDRPQASQLPFTASGGKLPSISELDLSLAGKNKPGNLTFNSVPFWKIHIN
jgi:hypothetical protein